MNIKHSFGTRSLALVLCLIMVLGMLPPVRVFAENSSVAQIGETVFETLEEALATVPSGKNAAKTTITLLDDTTYGFDLGTEDGTAPQNVVLDLNGNTLTLAPAVGSAGTVSSGIRVLANSELEIKNGKVVCSKNADDNIKVGIANYGTLKLRSVELVAGPVTIYSVNNRGELTLSGSTKIADGTGEKFQFAITNDPYEYVYSNTDAVVNCDSSAVTVGSMQVERYARSTTNSGGVVLNISDGSFGKIVEDGNDSVDVDYNVSGGTISVSNGNELANAVKAAGSKGTVTIKLTGNVTRGFDLGNESGTAPKSVVLDLNDHTLTLSPAVGSTGTVSSGIRVLANSSLVIKNGKVVCSKDAEDNIKVGISNYSDLKLNDVELVAGPVTIYSINNRGNLVLAGDTTIANGTGEKFQFAITNDPYEYVYSDTDAVLTCESGSVTVGDIQVERYDRSTTNKGGVVLNITAGEFGKLVDDGKTAVDAKYNITGGTFANDVDEKGFVAEGYESVSDGDGYKVQFIKLEQDALTFKQEGTIEVTYADGLVVENKAQGGSGTGTITYAVVEGDAARIPSENKAEVEVLKAGTVTIRATKAGDDTYVSASAEYVLEITPADRTASFEKDSVNVKYGTLNYTNDTLSVTKGGGDVSYEIVEGDKIASINKTTGELKFRDNGMGKVVVRATVAADDCYESCSATYTVNVKALKTPEDAYKLTGKEGENGWFRGDVVLTPADGYTVSTSNSLVDAKWTDSLEFTEEGVTSEVIYLKNADGYITDEIKVNVSIDKTAPADLGIEYANQKWTLSNLLGGNQAVDVTFNVTETGSGIAKLEYSKDGENFETVTPKDGKYTVSVDPEYRGQISFTVTDKAGWETKLDDDGNTLVVDAISPSITSEKKGSYTADEDGTLLTSADTFQVIYTIKDNHMDLLREATEIYVNGKLAEPVWEEGNGFYTVTLTFSEENTYEVVAKFSDYSNTAEDTFTLKVDRTDAKLTVGSKTDPVSSENGVDYFGSDVTLEMIVTEDGFKSKNAAVNVQYTAVGSTRPSTNKVSVNWQRENYFSNKVDASTTFKNEGTYTVTVSYKEGRNNTITSEPYTFVIDKTAPDTPTIQYETVTLGFVERLKQTFSFSKETVSVTISARDALSGVDHLLYTVNGQDAQMVTADMLNDNSYTFMIEPEYRGTVTVEAFDKADNSATQTETKTLVIDTTNPELTVGYAGAYNASSDQENMVSTNDNDFRLIFTASDENFDIRKNDPKIQIRKVGEEDWKDHKNVELSEEAKVATVALPEDGLYEVRYLLEDWLRTTEMIVVVNADRTGPAISVDYAKDAADDGIRYFDAAQEVVVEITEPNFDAALVDLKVTLNGTEQADYTAYAAEAENWTADGDTHTLKLSFDQEGTYNLTVNAMDTLDNEQQTAVNDTFVVDLSDPENLQIVYDEGFAFVETVLGWFGFSYEEVTATLTAEDPVSDVALVEVSTNGRDFEVIEPDENGAYTYTMKAQFRDTLTLRVTDKAGRTAILRDQGAVVVDTIAPDIFYNYTEDFRDHEGVYYSNAEEFPVEILVEDANYDLRAQNAVVTLNGVEQELTWNDGVSENGEPYGSAVVTLAGEGSNVLAAKFDDRLNPAERTQNIVLDRIAPVMDVAFSGEIQNDVDGKLFFNAAQTVTVSIDEVNFLAEEVELKVTGKNGREMERYSKQAKNPENWENGELKLEVAEDGFYTLEVSYTDLAGNVGVRKDTTETTYKVAFVVDSKAPAVETITYDQKVIEQFVESVSLGFFKAPLYVTVAASDETAGVNTIHYSYIGTKGVNDDAEVNVTGSEQVNESGEITFTIESGFYGQVSAWAVDYSNHESAHVSVAKDADGKELQEIVVDSNIPLREVTITPAENVQMNILDGETMENLDTFQEGDKVVLYFNGTALVDVAVTEENFYEDNYVIEVTRDGETVAVEMTEWTSAGDSKFTRQVTLSEDGDYLVTVSGTDNSGNEMVPYESQRIVVDQTAPNIDVAYQLNADEVLGAEEEDITIEPNTEDPWNTEYYLNRALTATITIEEHNFRASDVKILVTANDVEGNAVLELTEDNVVKQYFEQGQDASEWPAFEEGTWRRVDNTYVIDLVFNADANYTFAVEYTDLAGNEAAYEQRTFSVDNFDPVIIVEGIADGDYYCDAAEPTAAVIKIQDQNLDAEKIVYEITAKDAAGADVAFTAPDLHDPANWTYADGMWTATVPFNVEANYTFTLSYTDRSGRVGEVNGEADVTEYKAAFTVDYNTPTDLAITYETPVATIDEDGTSVQYFDKDTKVTLSARDITAGMMKFILTVTPDGHETACSYDLPAEPVEIPYNAELDDINELLMDGITADSITYAGGVMTVVLNVPAEFRGSFSFDAVDMATLEASLDDNFVVVTDTEAPERKVEMEPTQIVDRKTMKNFQGDLAEDSDVVLYFNEDAVLNFTLTEANFYHDEPVLTVNGQEVYLGWTEDSSEPGTYHASYTLFEDGDYVVELSYTDRSGNEMETYTSQRIVVDKTAPQVTVSYDNHNVKNTIGGREYYDNTRVATITVREENFRADDVKVTVNSTNVTGASLENSFAKRAANRGNWSGYNDDTMEWRRVDDTYVLKLTYSADANYTFDIEYQDMATNKAKYRGQNDYVPDKFTVDHNDPENLKISYSMKVLETILEGISFGFYDAKMTVTLRADDATSGIHRFVYSYVTSKGVSNVNSGKTDQVIEEKDMTFSNNGRTATATFTIPQSALNNKNQFNGTVSFTAYDRSENSADLSDKARIVVDNISPVATVSYNKPVRTVDGVAYYSSKIEATITINEANFYKDDVTVSVTRDGESYSVKPTWTNSSADIHVGKFTLDKEGDYIVTIRHTDKSGNSMKQYVSGKMIVDLEAPTIAVSNVAANSANKDEVYSFTITVNDADGNLSAGDIAPSLSYVVRDEFGNHSTKEFDLGDAVVVASGKTFTYTVEDLPEDAIYTLSCTAKDLAGNAVNVMNLDDGSTEEAVRFSINRHGSTFEYGDSNTRELAEKYYIQNVKNDLVINEINVDPVEQFSVTVNGKTLVNGVDYQTTVSGGGNAWSVRTYTISKDLFAEEGEYNVVISSVDATNTTVFSDMKNLSMAFVVDRTAPTVVLGGLEQGGRYQEEKQTVTLIPSDEGGQLAEVRIELFADGADPDSDECIDVLFEKSGDELMQYLRENDGVVTFEVPEGYQHQVKVICRDYAQGEGSSTNEYVLTYSDVTVSPEALVIFYANKPAFFGTIFGVLALLLFIFFLIFKRKKKDEEEEENKE